MASQRIGETGLSDSGPSNHHHHIPYATAAALHGINTHTGFMYVFLISKFRKKKNSRYNN